MHKLSKNAETLVFLVPVVPLALALILFCTILHYTELYCTVLNCTVLKCTKCTGLYPGPSSTTKWVLSFFFTGGAKVSNCFHIPVFCLACTQYIVQFSCNNTGTGAPLTARWPVCLESVSAFQAMYSYANIGSAPQQGQDSSSGDTAPWAMGNGQVQGKNMEKVRSKKT